MRQAHVIMSKWLSLPGIFKELSAATQGERQGEREEEGKMEGEEPENNKEWRDFSSLERSGADEKGVGKTSHQTKVTCGSHKEG